MALRSSNPAARLIAMAAGFAMLVSCAACGAAQDGTQGDASSSGDAAATSKATAGSAVIFTPSDGITISQRTPLNKWAKLTPEITAKLVDAGMAKKSIETKTSSDLDAQSRDVQDWVVDHMTADDASKSGKEEAKRTTLIVAPAVSMDSSTRQYGDYVTRPQSESSSDTSQSGSTGTDSTDTSAGDEAQDDAYARLASALQLAQDSGMHVVLLANGVDDITSDAFVRFSTAEQIGRVQAQKLVTKLDLAKASKDNPKAVEVFIPYSADARDGDETADAVDDDAFAREAFAGIWKVLQPYFTQGKAYSPSGLLTKDTSDDDWNDVTVDATDEKRITAEVDKRLPTKKTADGTSYTRIDGVIAMNDYVASAVTDELDALGYTGSAADINPQITISGIVGNIAGRKDLQRGSVPDPAKAPEDDGTGSDDSGDTDTPVRSGVDETNRRWPIVTGFGGYVDTMPQVVNGKQWMTGLENRVALASDTAEVTVRLNRGESLDKLAYVSKKKAPGALKKTSVVEEELLAVSASNLKATLIDPGYITMADAGL
ncbi:hypothetical protein [Bifidobacterium stellenboschense]|uniref:Multiple sugar-binding periplasmic protein n=1 Tax=Bifidobacterium stellenboschense TaxID=762211 RepID=A0A087DPD6_9BIFI|nr:hypothetical protein [Bifidobacterium stellenboschense]KFI97386.1 multiple sugar-binding periplasmic protein [Bifidobacterium stellenboschense]